MNKKITLLKRTAAWVLSAALAFGGVSAYAVDVNVGGDDFSKYAQDAVPGGDWTVTAPANSEIKVKDSMLSFTTASSFSNKNAGDAVARYTLSEEQSGVVYIEYRVKLANTTADFCAPYVYAAPDKKGRSVCTMFNNKGKIQTRIGNAYVDIGTYESGRWYTIKHMLDCDNAVYSVYIDGVECASEVSFRDGKAASKVSYMEFYTSKANADIHIDDLRIYKTEKSVLKVEEIRLITQNGTMTLNDGMSFVPTDTEAVEIEFSDVPDTNTLNDDNIAVDGVDYEGAPSGKVWRINLKETLEAGKKYTIRINGVAVGDSDPVNKSYSFTTMRDMLYFEGFEFSDIGTLPEGFEKTGGIVGVKDSGSDKGKVLQIEGDSEQSTVTFAVVPKDFDIDGDGIFVLEFDVYTQKSANAGIPYIYNSYNQASVCSVFSNGGQINVRNGENNVSVGSFTENKWHNIKICCNFKDGTFNYLLDGKLVGEKFSYRYKLDSEGGEVRFYIPEGRDGKVMIDNFSMYQAEIPAIDTENIVFSSADEKTSDKTGVMADVKTVTLGCDFEASKLESVIERNGKSIDTKAEIKNSKLVISVNEPLVYGGEYKLLVNAETVYGAKGSLSLDFKVRETDITVKKVEFTDKGASAVLVNNTKDNKNIRVIIASFDENNIMTGINCLNPTLISGENTVTAELNAKDNLKLYIWNDNMCGPYEYRVFTKDSEEGKAEKKPAQDNIKLTLPEKLEIKYPEYSGKLEISSTVGGIVSAIVLKKGATPKSFENSDVLYIGQLLCNENNKAVFDITVGSTSLLSGEYDIYAGMDGMIENKRIPLNVVGADAVEDIVVLIDGSTTDTELIQTVFDNAQLLGIQTKEAADNEVFYAYLKDALFKRIKFSTYDSFVAVYNNLYYTWIFNNAEDTSGCVEKYAQMVGIDLSENSALTLLFKDESGAKAFIEDKLSKKKDFTECGKIGEFYNKEAALYAVNTAERGDILERCIMFEKWLGIEAEETIRELTNSQMQELAVELTEQQEYADIEDFGKIFDQTAEDVTKPKSNNKGSSGGGGGGGGGSAFAGVASVETNTEKNMVKTDSTGFSDVKATDWFAAYVNRLSAAGIVSGDEKGDFNPDKLITRAEYIKLLTDVTGCYDASLVSDFDDVSPDKWYSAYIASARKSGFVSGYNNKVDPDCNITRQDAAVMAVLAAESAGVLFDGGDEKAFDDSFEIASYALDSVIKLTRSGVISGMGNGSFAPKGQMTRAQAAVVICKLMEVLG